MEQQKPEVEQGQEEQTIKNDGDETNEPVVQQKKKKNKKKKKKEKKKNAIEFPVPLTNMTAEDARELNKAFLKERLREAKRCRRGLRDRGDIEERTRNAIAKAGPEQLQEAARTFGGSPECLKKLQDLAKQVGVEIPNA